MSDLLNTITTGDARELAKCIPDNSIDLIFTDPPYLKANMEDGTYSWLAEVAARVLKPGGFLLAYAGKLYKHQIELMLDEHLSYFFDFISWEPGHISMLHTIKVAGMHKHILAYTKGRGLPRKYVFSIWKSRIEDKRYHAWGQNASTARYYINCFSRPGDTIFEPFTGGGTTLYACKQLERNFIGFEIDTAQADIARKRLETVQPLLMPEESTNLELWSA